MQPGQEVIPVNDPANQFVTGLEDFDESDLRLPRLSIDHESGGYVDSLNPELKMPVISVIPLGLVKQRVMWPALMTDDNADSSPMCKSTDFQTGYPNTTSTDPRELFPWQAATSGWHPDAFPKDDVGRITLPCNSCRFKDWKSHPDGKKTWCSEQHAIVLLYAMYDPESPYNAPPSMLALFTAQRSSMNASKAFFGGMVRQNMPAFAFTAKWSLRAEQRGKNKYYTPLMTITGKTDPNEWPNYQMPYVEVRNFITQPPRVRDDQQQAAVTGQAMGQYNQNQGYQNPGFQSNTWAPGQQTTPAQPVVIQHQPVQTRPAVEVTHHVTRNPAQQAPAQVQVQPTQPPIDPAYLEWKRQQEAATDAKAAPTAEPSLPFAPPVVAATPSQPQTAPTPGRDDDDLPF